MIIIYQGFEFIASFIESFVLYRIYNAFLHKQRKRQGVKIDIVLSVVGAIIILLGNSISLFSYFTMFIFVLYASIMALFLYEIKYVPLFSIASFYVLCLSCFDFFVVTLISNFYGGLEAFHTIISQRGTFRMIVTSVIQFLWIMMYLLIKKHLYRFSFRQNSAYAIMGVSCAGFLGFVFLVNQTFSAFDFSITGIWFVFLALLALVLFLMYFIFESKEEKMKRNFAEMRNQLLEDNYKAINDIYMSNSKLYHDLNNHLNVLYQLLDQGNEDEAKKYIQEISKPILTMSQATWTGVDVVDVIINSKVEKMKEKGITYEINVEYPKNTNILPHDMCTILANLLDNAIEAVSELESPGSIALTIRRINNFLMIKVSNSCVERKNSFDHFPKTTKMKNKELHGWGLPSVADAVEKYNGTLKCTYENNLFIVSIMLFFDISMA